MLKKINEKEGKNPRYFIMEFSEINSYFRYLQNHLVITVCRFCLPPRTCVPGSFSHPPRIGDSLIQQTCCSVVPCLVGWFSFLASHLSLFQPFPASLLTNLNWMQQLPALLCLSSSKSLCLNFGEAISQSL